MPKASRSRTIGAGREATWRVVSDPHQLSRWWPRVSRVEGVRERRRGAGTQWTTVLETSSGRGVRADFRCLYARAGEACAWEQEIEGSPFAKVLRSAVTTVELDDADQGTRVRIELAQRLRGLSRLGGFMMKRATGAQLEEALAGLERALVEPDRTGGAGKAGEPGAGAP
jgi:uncharacterized protein YndB with AHSA1/START domain